MTKRAKSNETTSAATIVTASALKNSPVTPLMNASGRNTTIVALVDPRRGTPISAAASSNACGVRTAFCCIRRIICSSITTASSTTRPTAAAIPPSVIMLKLMPSAKSIKQVAAKTAGSIRPVMTISRPDRRNTNSTMPASRAPKRMASRTALAAPTTSSD